MEADFVFQAVWEEIKRWDGEGRKGVTRVGCLLQVVDNKIEIETSFFDLNGMGGTFSTRVLMPNLVAKIKFFHTLHFRGQDCGVT